MAARTIPEIINETIGKEGKFSDHPADRGGPTMWGITEKVARENGYTGPMSQMPRSTAYEIYESVYLHAPGFSRVLALNEDIATELFDTGVNAGVGTASRMLQRALNILNEPLDNLTLYPDLKVDGDIGTVTITSLELFLKYRKAAGEVVMMRLLNGFQVEHYARITEKRPANERFLFGWILNRVVM